MKIIKVINQDKKPTLPIINKAMDRAKLAIEIAVKEYQKYWDIIDDRWYKYLHQNLHATGNYA